MFLIRATTPCDLGPVADLLARLPGGAPVPACRVGELTADWLLGSVLAQRGSGELVGFLGVRVHTAARRAWLHGPFIDLPVRHPAAAALWDRTADAMLGRVRESALLTACRDVELLAYVEHRPLVTFAARHGFAAEPRTRMLRLDGRGVRAVLLRPAQAAGGGAGDALIEPTSPRSAGVAKLHAALDARDPSGPVTAWDGECTVVSVVRDGCVIGYAAGGVTAGEYTVDAVGVRPADRGRGLGRCLLTGLLRELALQHGPRAAACAAVRRGDTAAERLFAAAGFRPIVELTPYRRAW